MRLQCAQISNGINSEYRILDNSTTLCSVIIPLEILNQKIDLYDNFGNVLYKLSFSPSEVYNNRKRQRREERIKPFSIYTADGENIGNLYGKRTKKFNGYLYYELNIYDNLYRIYEIGLGKEGIKIVIEKDGEQVALIEKGTVVRNFNDTYDLYIKGDKGALPVILFTVYYDNIRFGNRGVVGRNIKEVYYFYSTNKELKAKYNPNFKNIIRLK